jgi:hypothetical protein
MRLGEHWRRDTLPWAGKIKLLAGPGEESGQADPDIVQSIDCYCASFFLVLLVAKK